MTLGRGAYSHILPRTIDEGDFSTPLRFRRNDNGRGKLTAIYRSADRDLGAFQSLTMFTEILHCVQDDGVKAERCVYYLLFFIGPLFSRIS